MPMIAQYCCFFYSSRLLMTDQLWLSTAALFVIFRDGRSHFRWFLVQCAGRCCGSVGAAFDFQWLHCRVEGHDQPSYLESQSNTGNWFVVWNIFFFELTIQIMHLCVNMLSFCAFFLPPKDNDYPSYDFRKYAFQGVGWTSPGNDTELELCSLPNKCDTLVDFPGTVQPGHRGALRCGSWRQILSPAATAGTGRKYHWAASIFRLLGRRDVPRSEQDFLERSKLQALTWMPSVGHRRYSSGAQCCKLPEVLQRWWSICLCHHWTSNLHQPLQSKISLEEAGLFDWILHCIFALPRWSASDSVWTLGWKCPGMAAGCGH